MTSQYNALLAEAKVRGSGLARDYIPRMYRELVEVEKLDPYDAGERIKKDLVETWSRTTIFENLPDEAKHEDRGRPRKKEAEESDSKIDSKLPETIVLEQSSNHTHETTTIFEEEKDEKHFGDLIEQYKEREDSQKQDYDKLAEQYNQAQEKLEGLEADNEYQTQKIEQLGQLVETLQEARPNLVQATSKVQPQARNKNRGYWIRFDLSNVEITRPLINIIMRMKDRPKQFFIEILGDDVIEVSETKQ